MKPIMGKVEVTLSTVEVATINELIQRDKPMAMSVREIKWTDDDGSEKSSSLEECPVCGHSISTCKNFCGECGQRIDKANIAF